MHLETQTFAALMEIPDGFPGVAETLKIMSRLTKEGKKSLPVRQAALRLTQGCAQKDYACEVRELHRFVRDTVRYVQDINGVETLQEPRVTLQTMAGDCDDKAMLLAALLESIGHPTRFVAVGFEPMIFSHVYLETRIGGNWIPLEATEPVEAGWSPDSKMVLAGPYYRSN